MKPMPRSLAWGLLFYMIFWFVVVIPLSYEEIKPTQFIITEEVCEEEFKFLTEINEEYMRVNKLTSEFLYILKGDNLIEGNKLFKKETTCSQVEVNEIEYCPKIFEEGEGCLCGDFKISKQDLTIEWLYENAECVGGCELGCSKDYDNAKDMNRCIVERDCPRTPFPSCQKYKLNNYTINVLN